MKIIDKIIQCEKKYTKCFCQVIEQQDFIRFSDDLIPDMYYHNYTWLKGAKDNCALIELIESEILYSKKDNKDFCLIRCHVPVTDLILSKLSCKPEISVLGYYVLDVSGSPMFPHAEECSLLRVDKPEMLEDLLHLDLEHDEDCLGRDFCTRRVYRRKDIYLANDGVDSYICYYDGEAIGSCNLFIYGNTAKIEDFSVSPKKQRKGYGTAFLKMLIEIAIRKNVTTVYLETDEDDTAKEMYKKSGFYKIYEFTDLLFCF